ncbi:MAG: hypothetical protein QXU54_00395 [Candidatus Micrarchaeia archaeon]
MALVPYDLKVELSPLRLKKGDERPVTMKIRVKNLEQQENLTSILVEIPSTVGFDKTGFVSRKEIRVGNIAPNEEKVFDVDLFSHQKTNTGSYVIRVIANKHYRGYSHVFANAVKEVTLRIV